MKNYYSDIYTDNNIKLLHADSLIWLQNQPDNSITNIVSGIPDMEEIGAKSISEYVDWVYQIVMLMFQKTRSNGYIILIQTDRKIAKQWLDKSTLINNAAYELDWRLLWHKIVLNRPVGSANLHRPTYSHMLCYSQLSSPGNGLPDVIEAGKRWYKNATPVNAVKMAINFLLDKRDQWSRNVRDERGVGDLDPEIVDPFVGQGTIVYYAQKAGLSSLGIDIDENQIQLTRDILS